MTGPVIIVKLSLLGNVMKITDKSTFSKDSNKKLPLRSADSVSSV